MDTLLIAADTEAKQVPNMELAQKIYKYQHFLKSEPAKAASLKAEIIEIVTTEQMPSIYKDVCEKLGWSIDAAKLTSMQEKVDEVVQKATEKRAEAVENAGDSEVLDANLEIARAHTSSGNFTAAVEAYDDILTNAKKLTSNKRIDAMCDKCRIALFTGDLTQAGVLIEKTKALNEAGGDWDRRNRLKIYEALYLIHSREPKKAAPLLLECVETFTCVELCSYHDFMLYAVVLNIIVLSRTELHKRVVRNPQVIAMLGDIPHLGPLLHAIYDCDYAEFFRQMLNISPTLAADRHMGPQLAFVVREYRVLAYSQYLEAYKSVLVSSMASAFGLTTSMLDSEVSRFIAEGRISAKIDKVGGTIENSPKHDERSGQYASVVAKGDAVLNQVQKLARTLDM